MPTSTSHISANISKETKARMEAYANEFGVKKSHFIEAAILHHLSAIEELPADIVIPPIIEVSRHSGERILERLENPAPPTAAMKALFDD